MAEELTRILKGKPCRAPQVQTITSTSLVAHASELRLARYKKVHLASWRE